MKKIRHGGMEQKKRRFIKKYFRGRFEMKIRKDIFRADERARNFALFRAQKFGESF